MGFRAMRSSTTRDRETKTANALSDKERALIDRYWRAANYLSVGQIYLYDNPLLKRPLTKDHIKPRLLGHWGTTPGLNFIYVHLNRLIKKHDLDMIYITGPGPRRPWPGGERLPRRDLQRGLSEHFCRRRGHEAAVHPILVSRRRSRATLRPKRPARSTKAVNSATPSRTPTERPLTTRISSLPVSSATARRRPDRWRRAGIPTSS